MCRCTVCDACADPTELALDIRRGHRRRRHVVVGLIRQRSVGRLAAGVGGVLGGVRIRWGVVTVAVLVRRGWICGSYQAWSWVSHSVSRLGRLQVLRDESSR